MDDERYEGEDEMNKTGDSKAIIHNKYLSDNKMSRPRVFLEKVKKMKANKFSSNSAADMSSSFPAGPTYTYNPLAMKITARNVLNEQLRIMLCYVLRITLRHCNTDYFNNSPSRPTHAYQRPESQAHPQNLEHFRFSSKDINSHIYNYNKNSKNYFLFSFLVCKM